MVQAASAAMASVGRASVGRVVSAEGEPGAVALRAGPAEPEPAGAVDRPAVLAAGERVEVPAPEVERVEELAAQEWPEAAVPVAQVEAQTPALHAPMPVPMLVSMESVDRLAAVARVAPVARARVGPVAQARVAQLAAARVAAAVGLPAPEAVV